MEICSAVCLFERQCGAAYLKAIDPPEFNVENDLEILVANSFPDTPATDLIYTFTAGHNFCYTWIFGTEERAWSIVCLSQYVVPHQFYSLFVSLKGFLDDIGEPCLFLDHVYEFVRKWRIDDGMLEVPGQEAVPLQQNTDVTGFNPFLYFNAQVTVPSIWRAMISGGRILLRCSDPVVMSSAVFAAMSLLYPLAYREPVTICVSLDDPRLENERFEGMVAVLANAPVQDTKFDCVAVATRQNPVVDVAESQRIMLGKMARVKRTVDAVLNRQLLINPYSDLLEYPIVADDLIRYYPDEKMRGGITTDELRLFETTETFREYRRSVVFRDHFRQAFLSMDAQTALRGMSTQHLVEILDIIHELRKNPKYAHDAHFAAVLHKHKKIARMSVK